jgi:hypothetical protein
MPLAVYCIRSPYIECARPQMTRVTRPFTVEIKRSRVATRPPASPSAPAPQTDPDLSRAQFAEDPPLRVTPEPGGSSAARQAAEALFARVAKPHPQEPAAAIPLEESVPAPAGRRILADLNAKDPLEELLKARAQDFDRPRQPRPRAENGRHEEFAGASIPRKRPVVIEEPAATVVAARTAAPKPSSSPEPAKPAFANAASLAEEKPTSAPARAGRPVARPKRRGSQHLARGERWKRRLPEICR